MRPISQETGALLAQLQPGSTSSSRPGPGDDERVRLVEQVAERAEPASVIPLIDLLFDRSPEVSSAAAGAIGRALTAASVQDFVALDERLRGLSHYDRADGWKRLHPSEVAGLPGTPESRSGVLGLASCHRSGYVREQSVRLLAGNADGSELPFLLVRCNDWVGSVGSAARHAVEQRLRAGSFEPFIRHLHLVLRLASCGRGDHASLVRAVVSRLTEPPCAPALLGVVRRQHPAVARQLFRLAAEAPDPPLVRLVEAGLQANDPVLRLWAARRLRQVSSGQQLDDSLSRLEQDRSMPVRREALTARLEALPRTAGPALERALLNANPAIRELARFHLRGGWAGTFAGFYRDALAGRGRRAAAIAGLGETGGKPDAAVLAAFLDSQDGRERLAAVRAVGALAGDDYLGELVGRLTDGSLRVVRAAQEALSGRAGLLDPGRLWGIFKAEGRRSVRAAVVELIDRVGAWAALPYLIRAAGDPDEALAGRAHRHIERRLNRVFTRPNEQERRQIEAALGECANVLDVGLLEGLRRWIGNARA